MGGQRWETGTPVRGPGGINYFLRFLQHSRQYRVVWPVLLSCRATLAGSCGWVEQNPRRGLWSSSCGLVMLVFPLGADLLGNLGDVPVVEPPGRQEVWGR